MFDDLTFPIRRTISFVTGRGATTAAVAGAVILQPLWAGQPWLPAIGLAVGVPVTAALATVDHNHNEKVLRDRYRNEIAAVRKIQPHQVTIDHLRLVAEGDESQGLPGNRTLHEALLRNDRHRLIAVCANIGAAAITIGLVGLFTYFGAPGFLSGIASWLAEGANSAAKFVSTTFGIGSPEMASIGVSTIASSIAAGIASFGLDVAFKKLGTTLFGYETNGLSDRITAMGRGLRHGTAITEEQLMTLIIDAHPSVGAAIEKKYGLSFGHLPPEVRLDVLKVYDPPFELNATARALNLGLMPAAELAFTIEGVRSGAHPSPEALVAAYDRNRTEHPGLVETPLHETTRLVDRIPGYEKARGYVEKIGKSHPVEAGLSHAERLARTMYDDISQTVH